MSKQTRTFEDRPAVREEVPLLIGLSSPSGAGKTLSALRLAKGIQRVNGGDIWCIDTESGRSTHYVGKPWNMEFRHVPFGAPFGPLDYLAAVQHCVRKGAKTIIVDSMSHEHEGPGGVLEQHASEVERRSKGDWKKAQQVQMACWTKPKQERRRLINSILQLRCNMVFCFRAKEKLKIVKGKEPEPIGWQPIAGDEFIFEMTVHAFMYPGADGVPAWNSSMPGERAMMKLPAQFRGLLDTGAPFDERMGEQMAKWAKGDAPARSAPGAKFGRLKWSGAQEWAGKSLAVADEETLRDYRAALRDAIGGASDPAKRKAMEVNLVAVDALLPDDEPPDDWGDDGAEEPREPGSDG